MNELLKNRQSEFIENLAEFSYWNEKFDYIIELGQELPPMPENLKVPENLINTCKSKTYFVRQNNKIFGWSNSVVVMGLIAVVKNIFDDIDEISQDDKIFFHTESGLIDNLTMLRSAGLREMIRRATI